MPQIAGFRGALWGTGKAGASIDHVSDRIAKGELVRDVSRAMYRYHQTFPAGARALTRKSLFCAVKLLPWSEGSIRPHEATDPGALAKAIAGITAERAHTQAVLCGYRDAATELDRLVRKVEDARPTLDVTTADGTVHKLWRISSAETIGKVRQLFAPKKLHVLDGHARYEGMLAYQQKLGDLLQYSSGNYGLACLVNVEDAGLVSAPRHRLVRGLKKDAVLAAADRYFIVDKVPRKIEKIRAALADTLAHQPAFGAVFGGDSDAYVLTLKPDVSVVGEGIEVHRALQKYDPIVVDQLFMARCAPGATAVTELDVVKVMATDADLGLIARPLGVEQILHVDELGQTLPFGSTAFVPPVANLLALPIDPDEDLV